MGNVSQIVLNETDDRWCREMPFLIYPNDTTSVEIIENMDILDIFTS